MSEQTGQPSGRIVLETTCAAPVANVTDFLAQQTGLSKGRIKHALNCGALRVKKPRGSFQRIRRATAALPAGSVLSFHYDERLLALKPALPELLLDRQGYSVWFKPPLVLAQGSEWGDHCSLLRLAELHFQQQRQCFLVHRLDREASGLMLVAHSGQMADRLSHLFSTRALEKHYQVRVVGALSVTEGCIDQALDGKPAVTRFQVLEQNAHDSLLAVQIDTGRKHQIRRHLAALGHPVLGDGRYGEASVSGLCLIAVRLRFLCPLSGQDLEVVLPPPLMARCRC